LCTVRGAIERRKVVEPTLVLLPGMDGTGWLFEPFVQSLGDAQRVHVIAYPNTLVLGHGELIAHALSDLPAEGPLVLLGESFSGPLAVALSARCPARVIGLILCCSFVRNPRPWGRPLMRWIPAVRVPAPLAARALFGAQAGTEQVRLLKRALDAVSPQVLRARMRVVAATDVSGDLEKLKIPLLYLQARRDRLVPHSALARVAALAPQTRVAVFDGPHALLQTLPKETAQAVRAFVDGLSAAR
jgi:pimeloyl-[acyl-carrier protein] methyl ester esterase